MFLCWMCNIFMASRVIVRALVQAKRLNVHMLDACFFFSVCRMRHQTVRNKTATKLLGMHTRLTIFLDIDDITEIPFEHSQTSDAYNPNYYCKNTDKPFETRVISAAL